MTHVPSSPSRHQERARRGLALLFLFTISWGTVAGIGVGAVGVLAPRPVEAQGDLLGGLLGGDVGGLLPLLLLISLLMQLFGGGGSTPQQGPPDEQEPFQPSVGPQRTGPRFPTGGIPPPAPSVAPVPAMTLQSGGTLLPNTMTISSGSAVDVNNATGNAVTIAVRRMGETTNLAEASVAAGSSHRLRFQNAGTFELVTGTQIAGTVAVQ